MHWTNLSIDSYFNVIIGLDFNSNELGLIRHSGTLHMLLGVSIRSSDKLPVYVSGYTPIAEFREHTSIRFQ